MVPGLPAGRLKVERSWVPVYKLEAQAETVLSVLCGDDAGDRISRGLTVLGELDLAFSVQRLLSESPHTQAGKEEIDAVVDFAERCLLAAFVPVTVGRLRYQPMRFRRTMLDETILNWNQVSVLFSITYKVVS